MEQLLLSAKRLASRTILNEGRLPVFKLLQKHAATCGCVEVDEKLKDVDLVIKWSEVTTPKEKHAFGDELLSERLAQYKFQYLGHFLGKGKTIKGENWINSEQKESNEIFQAELNQDSVHCTAFNGKGNVNATWLIDFLANAPKIDADPLRDETLKAEPIKGGFVIQLSRSRSNYEEVQQFYFNKSLKALYWVHSCYINR